MHCRQCNLKQSATRTVDVYFMTSSRIDGRSTCIITALSITAPVADCMHYESVEKCVKSRKLKARWQDFWYHNPEAGQD